MIFRDRVSGRKVPCYWIAGANRFSKVGFLRPKSETPPLKSIIASNLSASLI